MVVLIVDDAKDIHIQLKAFLKSYSELELLFTFSAKGAFSILGIDDGDEARHEVDLILMDITMPETDGIEACKIIKSDKRFEDVPIIMVTADSTTEGLQAAFDAGAIDYITKPINKIELQSRVRSVLKLKHEMDTRKAREAELLWLAKMLDETNRALEQANQKLQRLSNTDGLTDVANRRHFDEVFQSEWKRAYRYQRHIAALMIDIDFFKSYNDAYGHQEGDECLKNVADTLKQVFKRAGDLVARYGGEEFVILLPDLDVVQAQALAEQIHQHLARLNLTHHQSPYGRATVSIGVASCVPNTSLAPSDLVKEADKALYQAKAAGRNQTRRFEGFF